MPPPETRPPETQDVLRFARAERWAHWAVGLFTSVCILTAAILYLAPLAVLVGHRNVVELIHVYTGFALPLPLIGALASRAYRADLRRLDGFTRADWAWLRSARRRADGTGVGKFNAGQKLNTTLSGAAILVLVGTGLIMYFPGWTALTYRTGATFVHDWFALALGLLVVGHIGKALRDPEAMRGMRTGWVHRAWVGHEHEGWAAELADTTDEPDRP